MLLLDASFGQPPSLPRCGFGLQHQGALVTASAASAGIAALVLFLYSYIFPQEPSALVLFSHLFHDKVLPSSEILYSGEQRCTIRCHLQR